MTESVILVGAEEVSRASLRMEDAAASMRLTASSLEETSHHQQTFLNEWLDRFEAILREHREAEAQP